MGKKAHWKVNNEQNEKTNSDEFFERKVLNKSYEKYKIKMSKDVWMMFNYPYNKFIKKKLEIKKRNLQNG
jgi:hypothetical protein